MVELEQRVKGKEVEHSFKGIIQSVNDKHHIIHEAFQLLTNPAKNKRTEKLFIVKLKQYLDELERYVKELRKV